MVDRIYTMEGYTPLVLQRVHPPTANPETMFDLLNVRFITTTDTVNRRLVLQERQRFLARAHMVYDVRIMRSEEELLAALKDPSFNPAATALVEGDFPAQSAIAEGAVPAWKAEITEMQDNSIRLAVTTERDGLLVLSETFYPGWNAYVDGKVTPVYRTDYNLRGVVIPAGNHAVVFRFEPESFRYGLWITLTTLVLSIGGWGISWKRSRGTALRAEAA